VETINVDLIIFDLDCTLIDSSEDIAWAENTALADLDYGRIPALCSTDMIITVGQDYCPSSSMPTSPTPVPPPTPLTIAVYAPGGSVTSMAAS